jgi:hypothetical protein
MNPVVKNILAVLAGYFVGSLINGGLIAVSGSIIPPPPGTDLSTAEGLKAAIGLFEPKHFVFPFLAHAVGTLAGAAVAAYIAASSKLAIAMVVGALFLAGGLYVDLVMIPGPVWFTVLDLVAAYIPMAWLGWKLATRRT